MENSKHGTHNITMITSNKLIHDWPNYVIQQSPSQQTAKCLYYKYGLISCASLLPELGHNRRESSSNACRQLMKIFLCLYQAKVNENSNTKSQ